MKALNRRQFLAAGVGAAGAAAAGAGLTGYVWPLLAREDLVPGTPPDIELEPQAWAVTDDEVTFAAIGDNGSGGRQAMAVAARMAATYQEVPFGLVAMLGDICYYGSFSRRFPDVFERPLRPLIDAGVRFELAVGNHDTELFHSRESLEEIEAELRLLGTPGPYYATTHGPVDLFYLDSSVPGLFGPDGAAQRRWLDDALAASTSRWRVVAMHHPLYSSGRHGSNRRAREVLEPIFVRHGVDLVLSGHDHHYERTHAQQGVTYVVSGGGCKTTRTGRSRFTAHAESILQFVLVRVRGDRLVGACIRPDGAVADRFELRARDRA